MFVFVLVILFHKFFSSINFFTIVVFVINTLMIIFNFIVSPTKALIVTLNNFVNSLGLVFRDFETVDDRYLSIYVLFDFRSKQKFKRVTSVESKRLEAIFNIVDWQVLQLIVFDK